MRKTSILQNNQVRKAGHLRGKSIQRKSGLFSGYFKQLSDAVAYGQVICDDAGRPVKFVLLEVSQPLLQQFGIPANTKITGKITRWLFPHIDGQWIDILGEVALNRSAFRCDVYSSRISKYLSINVFSLVKGQFVAWFEDITERKHNEKALVIMGDLVKSCTTYTNLTEILNLSLEAALNIAAAEWGSTYLVDPVSGHLNIMVHKGLGAGFIEAVSHYENKSRYAQIVLSGVPVYSLYENQYLGMDNATLNEGIKAGAAIPVLYGSRVIACLNIGFRKKIAIPGEIRLILEMVASIVGGQIARLRGTAQLHESEGKYANLVNEANDGVSIAQDNVFRFVNPAFENITGYKASEMIGMPFRRLLTPKYKDFVEKRYYARLSGREVPNLYEAQIKCKSGTIKDIELSASIVNYCEQPATMTIVRDITERKALESKVEESNRKFRDMTEMSPDWIWETDKKARFSYVNPAASWMLGYSEHEMIGRYRSDFMTKESAKKHKDFIKIITDQYQALYSAEEEMKSKRGRVVVVETRATPMFNSRNRLIGYLGISRDITQRKKLDRLRMLFLSQVSHELRTPLATLKGFATTLLASDVAWSDEERMDFIHTMDQQIDRLTRYITQLMDLSQLEMGVFKLNRQFCRINDIMDDTRYELLTITQHRKLKLAIPDGLPEIYADCLRIGQVISNLIDNAAKYSPEGSMISVSAICINKEIIISVTDEGPGIAPDWLPTLFQYFFRGKSTLTDEKHGTGLGLAICKGIIEEHGGRIWVENQHVKGAKFSFSIPLAGAG